MLLPNGRLELTQGAARHASRAAGARPEEIRNQSFACALALAGSGGFREARRFIAYLRLDERDRGMPMVVDIAYSTIIAFFLCWWLLKPAAATDVKATTAKATRSSSTDGALVQICSEGAASIGSKCIETTKRSLRAFQRSEQKPAITSVGFCFRA